MDHSPNYTSTDPDLTKDNNMSHSQEPNSQRNQDIGFLWLPDFNRTAIYAIQELLHSRSLRLGGTEIGAQYELIVKIYEAINGQLARILPQK